jgi:hypothetical protein
MSLGVIGKRLTAADVVISSMSVILHMDTCYDGEDGEGGKGDNAGV